MYLLSSIVLVSKFYLTKNENLINRIPGYLRLVVNTAMSYFAIFYLYNLYNFTSTFLLINGRNIMISKSRYVIDKTKRTCNPTLFLRQALKTLKYRLQITSTVQMSSILRYFQSTSLIIIIIGYMLFQRIVCYIL